MRFVYFGKCVHLPDIRTRDCLTRGILQRAFWRGDISPVKNSGNRMQRETGCIAVLLPATLRITPEMPFNAQIRARGRHPGSPLKKVSDVPLRLGRGGKGKRISKMLDTLDSLALSAVRRQRQRWTRGVLRRDRGNFSVFYGQRITHC